jgi:diacylglycerol kinase (ATP)
MNEYKIIVNPTSRNVEQKLSVAEDMLNHNNLNYSVYFTKARGDAETATRKFIRQGWRTFVVVGGDGTISEVINGFYEGGDLINKDLSLGIIPNGSANDFALNLGIPLDARGSCMRILQGKIKRVDLIQVECNHTRRLCQMDAGLGLSSEVLKRRRRKGKIINGLFMYLILALKTLLKYKNKTVRYVIDNKAVDINTTLFVISNGMYYLDVKFRPEAKMNDSLFEVTVLHDMKWWEILWGALVWLVRGRIPAIAKIKVMQAREVWVRSKKALKLNIGGELMGTTPARFSIVPKALRVIC